MSSDTAMRLSDDERWEATRVLDAAVADGRITWEEHAERSELVWSARTKGELDPVLRDLGPAKGATEPSQDVVATFSKIISTPENTREVHANATFGAVILNLSAMRPGEQISVIADSFCGKIALYVPTDAVVIDDGTVALGKRKVFGTSEGRGGPVVRIGGKITMGNIKVFRSAGPAW
ncbi:DUF1707 SHOCT-like domain-containing protein [Actinocrispum wychmicini]|uniref:Uncharacterized protein DUF1707 n=1 Tax=Actinocrispum wychmicini TaxID=1213861 RepID=A0A4R2JBJ2_9PSEU|nr:DUF1707 domain-containing protein [Actinocrispum wychmicini]TCO53429.1 uncharacterized protein DUF1707 [Actinocrispum wychmicini]